jgi:hypothetical protein
MAGREDAEALIGMVVHGQAKKNTLTSLDWA